MSSQALMVRDDAGLAVAFSEVALVLKTSALEKSALIAKVNDAGSQERAVDAQKDLSGILSQVEKARKAAKEPVLEFGRRIDDAAKAFVADLKDEQLRIATLVADYQQLEQARVRAAEQARLAEQRKLEEERRAAEQEAIRKAEIERARIAAEKAELERKAAEASAAERAKIEAAQRELEKQQKLAEAKSHEELDKIQEHHNRAVADLPVAAPTRVEGQRVREEWSITVTDIWTLARAHPVCVKIEPRLSEIKNLLDAGVKVAGVMASREIKAGVAGGRRQAAIDV